MFWMLIGGATLFALIVAGVMVAMLGGDAPKPQGSGTSVGQSADRGLAPEAAAPANGRRSDSSVLAEAEPLAKKFLEATSVEEILPLVRNPEVAAKRMKRLYPDGKIEATGMSAFSPQSEMSRIGPMTSIKVRIGGSEEKSLAFFEEPGGLRIDWESWVGWSEMSWDGFLQSKPRDGKVFRLNLSSVEYYNMSFSDDAKWQSYRLESPDGKHSVYGYAERGSVLNTRLRPPPEAKHIALTLSLKFPETGESRDQVLIEKIVADGWVLETGE